MTDIARNTDVMFSILISCKIRGVRDPTKRSDPASKQARMVHTQERTDQYVDDETRVVRIIGCKYRLLESEIRDLKVFFLGFKKRSVLFFLKITQTQSLKS